MNHFRFGSLNNASPVSSTIIIMGSIRSIL